MVVIQDPQNYRLTGFEPSKDGRHKYIAVLQHKKTGRKRSVPFGAIKADGTPYQHYHDKIGTYRSYDHMDKERRKRYRIRHKGQDRQKFSSGYFAMRYLW